ncbi:MAG: hypothetical protein ABS83_05540 [Rhodospirillales bacterium SCN 65-16]|nr:MAG: hypothetical protein ABS83_05540 [Rhodospirillales bacterium SCN 65-16]
MLAILLGVFGLGFLCWLLFTLAIYALPFLAGLTAGLAAFDTGSGVVGALVVGFLVGGATLALGQIGFVSTRTPMIRAIIGLLYAVPATVTGYQVSFALAGIGMSTGGWQTAFAVVGAILSGVTAFSRMTLFVPASDGQGIGGVHSPIGWRPHDQRR